MRNRCADRFATPGRDGRQCCAQTGYPQGRQVSSIRALNAARVRPVSRPTGSVPHRRSNSRARRAARAWRSAGSIGGDGPRVAIPVPPRLRLAIASHASTRIRPRRPCSRPPRDEALRAGARPGRLHPADDLHRPSKCSTTAVQLSTQSPVLMYSMPSMCSIAAWWIWPQMTPSTLVAARLLGDDLLEVADELHRLLDLDLGPGRERPVAQPNSRRSRRRCG